MSNERVTVGYQDGCLHPLWLGRLGLRLARIFGAESLWLPDHFMGWLPGHVWSEEHTPAAAIVQSSDAFLDPIQILATTALRIPGVDLGTAVTEPFRRHPVSLAQSFATLDHISKGHAILGIGNGERENVEPYGMDFRLQVSRLEEALTIITKMWSSKGEPVTYDGRFWQLKDAVFNLPLYQDSPPRIWIAAHAPRMLGLVGRFGDGWLPTLKMTPAEYSESLAAIKRSADEHGRDMENFVACQMVVVALGESRDAVLEIAMKSRVAAALVLIAPSTAWEEQGLKHPLGEGHRGFYDIVPSRVTEEDVDRAAATMTPELLLNSLYAGSPAEVRDELAPLVEAGARHLVVSNVASVFTGGGAADLWRLGSLFRKLRRM